MKKLSPENIRFIDTYLKKSGVEYFDIRVEMVDHVASEIEAREEKEEGEFYDHFKAYMATNKKPLLEGLKKYRKQADRKVYRQVLRNMYHPVTLILGTLLASGTHWLVQEFSLNPFNIQVFHFVFMIFLFVVPFLGKRKEKFSASNGLLRCGWMLYLLIVVNDMVFEFYHFWYFLILFVYEIALLRTILELRALFRNKFSML